jgi:sporulation protein YlmC with PRC-barrel domain
VKRDGYLKLVGEVRDLQIIDASGRRCGIADDIEFEGGTGTQLKVKALLVGPGAYQKRLPRWLKRIAAKLVGKKIVVVPWTQVARITSEIRLMQDAKVYGLGQKDLEWEKLLSKLPGARS